LPEIGEGLGEWSEASSYRKKRLEMLRSAGLALLKRGVPLEGTGIAKISA